MNDLLTDEQMAWIRDRAHDAGDGILLGQLLRVVLEHYDATVARHADIIANCRSALAGFTGPEESIPDEIVERNAHANANSDNLRVELTDARATRDRAQAAATAELERRRLVEACFARYREGLDKLRADLAAIMEVL